MVDLIVLNDLPKVSLNTWYAGTHWTKRKKLKDTYTLLVKSQFKKVYSKLNSYETEYIFYFKSRPLDASNCIAMAKMIEDIIFEDDNYKVVTKLSMESRKSDVDRVELKVIYKDKIRELKHNTKPLI